MNLYIENKKYHLKWSDLTWSHFLNIKSPHISKNHVNLYPLSFIASLVFTFAMRHANGPNMLHEPFHATTTTLLTIVIVVIWKPNLELALKFFAPDFGILVFLTKSELVSVIFDFLSTIFYFWV